METRAQQNRKIRQDALREQLASKGLVQHVIEIAEKLCDLEAELDQLQTQRLKAAADLKLKLVNKYLPDIKTTELTGEAGEKISVIINNA